MTTTVLDPTAEQRPATRERTVRPESLSGLTVGLLVVHAGGLAGLFSAIIGGWKNGPGGSDPVTREITP
ncbi:MAG: hypothetical protein MK189_08385 [Acidimicrobiales bacterium]|nr:hypothetical protein [Acidimicrobiales bacterium]